MPVFSERYVPHIQNWDTLALPDGAPLSWSPRRPDYVGQSFFVDNAHITRTVHDALQRLTEATDRAIASRGDNVSAPQGCGHLVLPDATGNIARRATPRSVYVGNAGILMALTRVLQQPHARRAVDVDDAAHTTVSLAQQLLLRMLPHVEEEVRTSPATAAEGVGFFMGPLGTCLVLLDAMVTLATVDVQHSHEWWMSRGASYVATIVAHAKGVLEAPSSTASELLYGISGAVYALQFLLSLVSEHPTTIGALVDVPKLQGIAAQLCRQLVQRGIDEARQQHASPHGASLPPLSLMWSWHGTRYLGAAHGATGILHQLLHAYHLLSDNDRSRVLQAVDELIELTMLNRGFLPTTWPEATIAVDPSTHAPLPSDTTTKVHWCHGTPGIVLMCVAAYRVTGAQRYVDVGDALVDGVVYPYGALRKGTGLCHGLCGNAYAFLAMYRATRRAKYLYYANRYMCIMSSPAYDASTRGYNDPQRLVPNCPDAPWSLMEGVAGTLCFLSDLAAPERSAFPGFEPRGGGGLSWTDVQWQSLVQQRDGAAGAPRVLLPAQGSTVGDGSLSSSIPTLASLVERCRPLSTGLDVIQCPALLTAAQCNALSTSICGSVSDEALCTAPVRVQPSVFGALLTDLTNFVQHVVDRHPALSMPWAPPQKDEPFATTLLPGLRRRPSSQPLARKFNAVWRTSWWSPERGDDCRKRLFATRAYVVRYDTQHHEHMRSHVDTSHVTLNICLFSDCAVGCGNLLFEQPELTSYHHTIGEGLVHRGDIPHHTHALRCPAPATAPLTLFKRLSKAPEAAAHRVQLVVLFEFEQDDTPLVKALYASNAPLCSALTVLPENVLGEVSLFLGLRDVATLLACGSRVWQRILEPRAGGLPATMLWRERAVCSCRIARWLPIVWPEYCSPGRPGFRGIMSGRTYDASLMRQRPFAPLLTHIRTASGIDRQTAQRIAAHNAKERVAGGCPSSVSPSTNEAEPSIAAALQGPRGVRFDTTSADSPRGPCYSLASTAHVDWTDVDEAIDWKAFLQHTLHFANTTRALLRHPADEDDPSTVEDDDDDTTEATGSSYTSPEVEAALRALASTSDDGNMSNCYRCVELMEAQLDRRALCDA